jgi:hypothetical protein
MTSTQEPDANVATKFKEYFVVCRGSEWWIVDDATSFGPYALRNTAVEAAMAMAAQELGSSINTKVFVEEKLLGDLFLVYDSTVDRDGSLANSSEGRSIAGQEL